MAGENTRKWLWILAALIVANAGYYLYSNWGLVTLKVHDAPLKEVIGSLEWQGWVKIYTNLPLDTKVSMYCDHVPLAEAMETLAANVDAPPPSDGDDNPRPRRNGFGLGASAGGSTNAASATAPADASTNGASTNGAPIAAGGPPPGGNPGAPGAGRPPGGGGFGRGAQWNLAFFTGPSSSQVKQEIREFESSDPDEDNKVYTYNTQSQIFSTDTTTVAPDPAQQAWPGYKPPPPDPNAPASANGANGSANTNTASAQPTPANQPDPNAPPTVHTYLQALAAAANIWIMAPGSWTPQVDAPPANSSIIGAVKQLIGSSHGVVVEALVLRAGRGGAPGNTNRNDDNWEDRMMNAINGLPADQRPDAIEQLHKEADFRKSVQTLPPDQRRQKMFEHFAERMIYGERLARLSPEKRAKAYQRMIQIRQAAKNGT
jgi:hypothetical protein